MYSVVHVNTGFAYTLPMSQIGDLLLGPRIQYDMTATSDPKAPWHCILPKLHPSGWMEDVREASHFATILQTFFFHEPRVRLVLQISPMGEVLEVRVDLRETRNERDYSAIYEKMAADDPVVKEDLQRLFVYCSRHDIRNATDVVTDSTLAEDAVQLRDLFYALECLYMTVRVKHSLKDALLVSLHSLETKLRRLLGIPEHLSLHLHSVHPSFLIALHQHLYQGLVSLLLHLLNHSLRRSRAEHGLSIESQRWERFAGMHGVIFSKEGGIAEVVYGKDVGGLPELPELSSSSDLVHVLRSVRNGYAHDVINKFLFRKSKSTDVIHSYTETVIVKLESPGELVVSSSTVPLSHLSPLVAICDAIGVTCEGKIVPVETLSYSACRNWLCRFTEPENVPQSVLIEEVVELTRQGQQLHTEVVSDYLGGRVSVENVFNSLRLSVNLGTWDTLEEESTQWSTEVRGLCEVILTNQIRYDQRAGHNLASLFRDGGKVIAMLLRTQNAESKSWWALVLRTISVILRDSVYAADTALLTNVAFIVYFVESMRLVEDVRPYLMACLPLRYLKRTTPVELLKLTLSNVDKIIGLPADESVLAALFLTLKYFAMNLSIAASEGVYLSPDITQRVRGFLHLSSRRGFATQPHSMLLTRLDEYG